MPCSKKPCSVAQGLLSRGFTLIEVMVALVIAAIIMLTMAQVFSETENGVSVVNRRLDSASLTQAALDRIGYDLCSRVAPDGGIGLTAIKNHGNDELIFYSNVRSTASNSRFAWLDFIVGTQQSTTSPGQTIPALLRGNSSVSWNVDPLTVTGGGTQDCLGLGIFRLEIAFLDATGMITASAPTSPTEVRAVIVAVAALNPQTYQILTVPEANSLAGKFNDAVDGQSPAANWSNISYSGLPLPVQQNVRIYERYFYVR